MCLRKLCSLFLHSLLFLSLFLTSGCVQTTYNVAQSNVENLRVGVSTNAPPLLYKTDRKLQGLEIDFAKQLAAALGKTVRFIELPWDKQIPALENGKIDIVMSGMTVTPKRSYRVAFSKPYLRSGQILLVRSNQAGKFSAGIYSIMGDKPKIGVIKDTTGDFFINKTINSPKLTRFSTSKNAVKSLLDEEIDVIVHDAPILTYYAAMNEGSLTPILRMATEEYYAWALHKNNVELLRQVNVFIDQQSKNNKLQATVSRWVPYL